MAGMWTTSSTDFMYDQDVSFTFTRDVDWEEFWSVTYLWKSELDFVLSKFGHYFGSWILAHLFFKWRGLRTSTLALLLLFVSFSEVTQEFFTRDARFLDIGINAVGVLTAAYIIGRNSSQKTKTTRKSAEQ